MDPMLLIKLRQNHAVNCTPQSEIIRRGASCNLYTCCMKSFANLRADGSPLQGMKWVCLEKRSITIQMNVLPLLSDNYPIKSIAISSHGLLGLAMGCNRPRGFPGLGFVLAHTGHVQNMFLSHSAYVATRIAVEQGVGFLKTRGVRLF